MNSKISKVTVWGGPTKHVNLSMGTQSINEMRVSQPVNSINYINISRRKRVNM